MDEVAILKKKGYTVGNKLGSGSYATVKSALWKKPGSVSMKQVALKIINILHIPKDFKDKFLPRELDVVRVLDHDNVIRTMEVFSGGKKTYMSLEYAAHGDLLQFIRVRGPLDDQVCSDMFAQIAAGLQYIHHHRIVHRDLKCENILLDSNNNVKIADFGFARKMTPTELSKTYCGSMAYAAPEILEGTPYVGYPADVWSIGVILFIMLSALMPFRDDSMANLTVDQRRPLRYPKNVVVPQNGKILVDKLLIVESDKRLKAQEILKQQWLKRSAGSSK